MELREHLGLVDSDIEARRLKFKVGRVREHWVKNCLAVGLSQGFIEPLEATALDMVQETVFRFVEAANKGDMTDRYRDEFNARISKRFDAVRDYIVCHYRINTRSDTDYWRDAGSNEKISPSLREMLTAWLGGKNITNEIDARSWMLTSRACRGTACWRARASIQLTSRCGPATSLPTNMICRTLKSIERAVR